MTDDSEFDSDEYAEFIENRRDSEDDSDFLSAVTRGEFEYSLRSEAEYEMFMDQSEY